MPTPILMPALSPTMETGTLAKWLKKEGDPIAPGDVIAEIETDKATMEVEAVDEGRLGRILVAEGTADVAVNAPIAVLLEEGEDEAALETFSAGAPAAAPDPDAEKAGRREPEVASEQADDRPGAASSGPAPGNRAQDRSDGDRVFASPLARRLASQNGIDLAAISGTGPHGRVIKRDVEAALAEGPARPAGREAASAPGAAAPAQKPGDVRALYEPDSYTEVPADNMRKTIARRMAQSFQEVPHFPLSVDCQLDALLEARGNLNARSPEGEGAFKLSVNDLIVKAAAMALMRVPDANASWAGDAILKHHHADIGIAVAIEGGLITPIIRRAEQKGLAAISSEARDLAARARDRKLQPQEYQGGTFTVSNLGMFGIKSFASILNQPQGAILSVGAGEQRPVVRDGALAVATVMTVTLTCDHRAVDGAIGAQFLRVFKGFIEEPVSMML